MATRAHYSNVWASLATATGKKEYRSSGVGAMRSPFSVSDAHRMQMVMRHILGESLALSWLCSPSAREISAVSISRR
jgi:hypothetical protein